MITNTITVSGAAFSPPMPAKPVEQPKMVEATTPLNGFDVTIKALREMGLDLKGVPMGLARMLYRSGVAFAKTDQATEEEKLRWRNSIIWPVKNTK